MLRRFNYAVKVNDGAAEDDWNTIGDGRSAEVCCRCGVDDRAAEDDWNTIRDGRSAEPQI